MTLVYAKEKLADTWDEVWAIAELHWSETEEYRHGQGFNPDKARYLKYEDMGLYHHFTVRSSGAVIGYGGFYIMPSMHTQKLVASEDTYFIHPGFRKGRVALTLFKMMEDEARRLGAVEFIVSTKLSNPRAEVIVGYMGYEFYEKRWSKPVKELSHVQS